MRIIDLFVHPVTVPDEQVLHSVSNDAIELNLIKISEQMVSLNVDKSMIAFFCDANLQIYHRYNYSNFIFSALADFRDQQGLDKLQLLSNAGVHSIVFHPYLQHISQLDWPLAVAYAREAGRLGMVVSVCTAFGSRKMYSVDVLPFATAIADAVNCPVIFSHCGGAKVLEAMLIAEAYENVFLDTSFSLSYWIGSTVEYDIAYAMRKIGIKRWFYGSDAPFVPMTKSLQDHFQFFERHRFSDSCVESIMGGNAAEFMRI